MMIPPKVVPHCVLDSRKEWLTKYHTIWTRRRACTSLGELGDLMYRIYNQNPIPAISNHKLLNKMPTAIPHSNFTYQAVHKRRMNAVPTIVTSMKKMVDSSTKLKTVHCFTNFEKRLFLCLCDMKTRATARPAAQY